MKKSLITLCAVLCAAFATAKDIKTLTLTTTPQMHCASCETKIKNQLRFEKGVKRIDTSVERQTVEIQYDADRTGSEQLIKSLAKIGYKAAIKRAEREPAHYPEREQARQQVKATPVKDAAKTGNAEKKGK